MVVATVRALFVIHNPGFGGGYNEILEQRAGLEAAGWELTVATCDGPNTGAERLADAGLKVVAMPLHRLRATREIAVHAAMAAGFVPEVAALRRLIRQHQIDVIQVHGETNFHAGIAGRLEHAGVCWHLYDLNAPPALRRMTTPLLTRLTGSVTVVGQATAAQYPGLERLGERLVVTFPPVDGRRFRPDPARRVAARHELGAADNALLIVTVGNRNSAKGHDVLIDAAAVLLRRLSHAEVVILGGTAPGHEQFEAGLHAAIARHGLEQRIRLVDPGSRVAHLLPAADLFVLPSRREAMPTVVLEAMACALPVVASDVGSIREEVVDGVTGAIVQAGDAAALAAALEWLAGDPDLRQRMGDVGRRRATELFTPERAVANRLRAWDLARAYERRRRVGWWR